MIPLCLDCGCGEPRNRHGSRDHIILPRLQRAAAAAGLPLMEAAWNVPRTLAAADHGNWPSTAPLLAGKPVLIWDCDGILAFTAEALCGALNARFGTSYNPLTEQFFPGTLITTRLPDEQGAWVSGLFREASFLRTFAPDFHALDVLRDAHDAGFHCEVVTERDPSMQDTTAAWLDDWGAPHVEVHTVGHGNKPAYMAQRYGPENPSVILDDNPAIQLTIARPGIEAWTPERSYTPEMLRPHTRAFGSWQEARYWLGLGLQP